MSAETLEFKAELKQLLHLITHSLYSDREIFLRELISNAADAINKIRFDSLDNDAQLEGDKDWKIRLSTDKDQGTLTISDNGIGMSREDVIEHLGTIAKSGTRAFLDALKAKADGQTAPGLIGQFGVGFYSAFMVADRVTVWTRPAGSPEQGVRWESDGQGQYSIESAEKPTRGTDVILHLKEDAKEFLEPWRLQTLVRKFSDFVEHPVVMATPPEEGKDEAPQDEILNSRKAIWLRSKSEVTAEEYNEFYSQIAHDREPPAKVLHFNVEGKTEFRALLFIPAKKPFSFDWEEPKAGLKLYVQRVLIMDRCEQVLPAYLRFVKGVVDSADLPLNVSRELLQQNPHLDTIQKNVVRNIFSGLEGMKNTEYEKYLSFYRDFGSLLKEGLTRDWSNREKIADLLLFESTAGEPGAFTTLGEYVEKMPTDQEAIYYLTGENAEMLRRSPYVEKYRAKGWNVLLCTDPIDEFALPAVPEYKGKKFQAIDRSDSDDADKDVPVEQREQFAGLITRFKALLPNVEDVRLTTRLTDSACCLVAPKDGMSAHLERMMKRMGENQPATKRILELNPEHAVVQALKGLYTEAPDDSRIEQYARLLYDQALLAEGSRPQNPAEFAQRINALILQGTLAR